MPDVYCGDPVSEKIGFSGYSEAKGDKQAHVVLTRNPDEPVQSFTLDVKNEEVEVKWPDQEKGSDYWGGAKAYLEGNDSWAAKWSRQVYFFQVIVGNYHKQSATITVKQYADQNTPDHVPTQISWQRFRNKTVVGWFGIQNEIVDRVSPPRPWRGTLGKFDIEMKEGAILITLKINFLPTSRFNPEVIARFMATGQADGQRICKQIEDFWNGGLAFQKFFFHRKKCARGNDCNCGWGCCRFPIRLKVIMAGGHHDVILHQVSGLKYFFLSQFRSQDYRADTENFFTGDGAQVFAHEAGHLLGLPDEYDSGVVASDPSIFPAEDRTSVMNSGTNVYARHLKYIAEWVESKYPGEFELKERS